MINLRAENGASLPSYKTSQSSGADLRANEDVIIGPLSHAKIKTGIFIDSVDLGGIPENQIPELQVRARSGLAAMFGIGLSNGVGTIDADYRDEICVLLWNSSEKEFAVKKGDRVAQLVLGLAYRIPNVKVEQNTRKGGFGSTGA